jgi:hypothetical protein
VSVQKFRPSQDLKSFQKELEKRLLENEQSRKNFILVNFNQQAFTDDADAGHIASVGAYDSTQRRVLILDPDRHYYEPYWVGIETLVTGLNTVDKSTQKPRGYLWIELTE